MQLLPVPKVKKFILCCCGLLNMILPGVGLMVASCIENNPNTFMTQFWMGLMQLMLASLIIGFIWSIVNGILMIYHALKCKKEKEEHVEAKQLRLVGRGRIM
ncbi:Transmembrane_domain-containing protein [Hexamita inflata]|uniref:Transmembrane domain-containing protein n=1 Tax=Hexamita inflata TaxID=28002 RepID=A0AA86NG31_9EUKA|nr:Transmembrane domain-containing protein [Hexamita inflata]CAI9929031.1 Transmembrane domain-containing protein [Hexamita inflata]CAI9957808.1 Transmembrane domain-containing protein [Hexamita inflata]